MDVVTYGDEAELGAVVAELTALSVELSEREARRTRLLADAMRLAVARTVGSGVRQTERQMQIRCVAAEIGAAVRVNDRTIQRRMDEAAHLVDLFPLTMERFTAGRVSLDHTRVIADAGCVLTDPAERAAFERVVLDYAETATPSRVRAFALELAERLHPESITTRHHRALTRRDVTVTEIDDGVAELRALLPTALAWAIRDRLTQQARTIRATTHADTPPEAPHPDPAHPAGRADPDAARFPADSAGPDAAEHPGLEDATIGAPAPTPAPVIDVRSLSEIRADILTDLLLTGSPTIDPSDTPGTLGTIRARVEITVPVTTLTGTTDRGATLNGRAPIDADTARHLAATAPGFDRIMTHPITAHPLTVDRYTPTPHMRRYLAARDRHCRFPGCRQPTRTCHIDHNHEHAHGGPTATSNLAHLCPRHHTLKTETPWTITQHADGTLTFTTPLGKRHSEKPPPRVSFHPDPAPF